MDFKKPVIVAGANGYEIYPNGIDPSKEILGNFFSMTDSYTNPLFGFTNGSYTDVKGIFAYYQINSVEIELPVVSGVEFSAEGMTEKTVDGKTVYVVEAADATGFATPAFLNTSKVVCNYTNGVLERDQNATVKVTVNYYWGSQTVNANVVVKAKPKA